MRNLTFAADQVALRKEAERQAKIKLTEDIHRRLFHKSRWQFMNAILVVQHLREELDRRIKEKKESKI